MSNIGIQALLLSHATLHLTMAHHELMGTMEVLRALGNSYRLAASEPGSSVIYGRFALDFFRTIVACLVR